MEFRCTVKSLETGAQTVCDFTADSEKEAIARLLDQNLAATELVRIGGELKPQRLSSQDQIFSARQLGILLRAGLTVTEALSSVYEHSSYHRKRQVWERVIFRVNNGSELSVALKKEIKNIDPTLVGIVSVAEKTGKLPEMLLDYARNMGRLQAAKRKMISAGAYPCLLICIAAAVVSFMFVRIVPAFADIYASFGLELPSATKLVLNASTFMRDNALYSLPGLLFILGAAYTCARTPVGRASADLIIRKLPIIGRLVISYRLSLFVRNLGCLISSGVPILEALRTAGQPIKSPSFVQALDKLHAQLEMGEEIAKAFRRTNILPRSMIRLIAVGEAAGNLDEMLFNTADVFDEEVETILQLYLPLVEPALIAGIGVVLGSIVITLFLPMARLSEIASGPVAGAL